MSALIYEFRGVGVGWGVLGGVFLEKSIVVEKFYFLSQEMILLKKFYGTSWHFNKFEVNILAPPSQKNSVTTNIPPRFLAGS